MNPVNAPLMGGATSSGYVDTNKTTGIGLLQSDRSTYDLADEYRRMTDKMQMIGTTSPITNAVLRDNSIYDEGSRRRMIAMRLRLADGVPWPFQSLHTALSQDGTKVFVFVVQKDTPVTLSDDAGLFPSDALVTQLRLIAE